MRLERGAVLLDSRRGRIIEVEEEAASTLDLVVFDEATRLPATDAEATRMRRALRAFRRELFDESPSPERLEIGPERTLLVGHDEPTRWRSPPGPNAAPGAVLTVGLIRREDGSALALAGPADVVSSVTAAFGERGISPCDVVICDKNDLFVRIGINESLRLVELWAVELGNRAGLTLVRLSLVRSLVKLLFSVVRRPSETELKTLALCAERVPHFVAVLPRDLASRTRAVTEYFRTATP